MDMVSLRQLKSFVAVFEEGSFTAAGEREGATQSGISQHVKTLEEELGTLLFGRNGRAIEATLAGKQYYLDCVDILKRLDAAHQEIAVRQNGGVARIGLMPLIARSILAPTLEKFLQTTPGSEISIIEAYSGVLTDLLLKGELDLAVVPAFEGAVGLSSQLLLRDREMLVTAKRNSGQHLKPVSLSSLGPLKVVLPGKQNTRRRNIETYFTANGVNVARRLEMDAMMGTLEFVAATDWVAVLPFVMMASDIDRDRFEIRPLADPPLYSDFILIEPSRKLMTPAAALFASVLKSEAERSTELFRERVAPQICS
jgi:LysR family nitrogen assimilation transcriptional regulator